MKITLTLLTNLYSEPDKNGNQKMIKKDIEFLKTFESNNINIQHYITPKGLISKKLCLVYEGDKDYLCKHKFEDLERLISPVKVKGYVYSKGNKTL